ncbi:MAG: NfeD family protein [Holophagales bacterium]|jgi:membrane protein implicated in regulation of membrane protease activity|nr:NfeD family protein [Holophagales bacterium]
MSPLIWLVIAIVLFVIEMVTPGVFFFACFGVGALIASLAAKLGLPSLGVWTLFFVVSLLLVLLVAPLVRRWMKKMPVVPVGLDSLEGQIAQVIEAIEPASVKGQVRLASGAIWRATSDHFLAEGSNAEIIRVTGVRLQVSPVSESVSNKE